MTDNEIIKALRYCSNDCEICRGLKYCPYHDSGALARAAFKIINDQKAEIEKYRQLGYCELLRENEILRSQTLMDDRYNSVKGELERLRFENAILVAPVKLIKQRAIKEFAATLKRYYGDVITEEEIDNLVREMAEESDNA